MFREIISLALLLAVAQAAFDISNFRIIKGDIAKIGQLPYMAAIYTGHEFRCGGVIISEKVILTHVSCVYGNGISQIGVVVGKTNINEREGRLLRLADFVYEEDYDALLYNELSALILREKLTFDENVQKLSLADGSEKLETGVVSGWGFYEHNSEEISTDLRYVRVPILSDGECKQKLGDSYTSTTICAGDPATGDACGGDVGNPLVVDNKVVGIVNSRYYCGTEGKPGTYENVAVLKEHVKRLLKSSKYYEP